MELGKVLHIVLSDRPTRKATSGFAYYAHGIASACLKKKMQSGFRINGLAGLSIDEIAWDSIADLFERDENGVFHKLRCVLRSPYTSGTNSLPDDDELEGLVHRVVMGKVNDSLFRIQREHDPSLGKLIRNLKNAVRDAPVTMKRISGTLWIVLEDDNPELLPMPPEFFEARLAAGLKNGLTLPDVLQRCLQILADQDLYRKCIPLTHLACIIRSAYIHTECCAGDADPEPLVQQDHARMVRHALQKVEPRMYATYVRSRKVSAETWLIYMECAREILIARYHENGSNRTSYYDFLKQKLIHLERDTYHEQHRSSLEYLVKVAHDQMLHLYRKDLDRISVT
ncbi:MAG: hypothetical protein ACNA8K_09065 [Cyclonatronaceae bacterium]